jgi:hypothetical protein
MNLFYVTHDNSKYMAELAFAVIHVSHQIVTFLATFCTFTHWRWWGLTYSLGSSIFLWYISGMLAPSFGQCQRGHGIQSGTALQGDSVHSSWDQPDSVLPDLAFWSGIHSFWSPRSLLIPCIVLKAWVMVGARLNPSNQSEVKTPSYNYHRAFISTLSAKPFQFI